MNDWKTLKIDNLPNDLFAANYEFRYFMGRSYGVDEFHELRFKDYDIIEYLKIMISLKKYNVDRYQYRISDIPREERNKKLYDEMMNRESILGGIDTEIQELNFRFKKELTWNSHYYTA